MKLLPVPTATVGGRHQSSSTRRQCLSMILARDGLASQTFV